jgi:hypothetical protein
VSGGPVNLLLVLAAIVVGFLFLIAMGALALWSSLTLISMIGWVFRLPGNARDRRHLRRERLRRGAAG